MIGEYRHKNLTLQNDLNFCRKILCKFKVHKKVVEIFLTDTDNCKHIVNNARTLLTEYSDNGIIDAVQKDECIIK